MLKRFAGLIVLMGLLWLQGCASLGSIEPPSVSLADISLQGATLLEQRYRLQLRVQNPNPTELPIDGLSYEVEINGKSFAKGLSNQSVTIPRYGSELLDVEGTSNLIDIVRQLVDLQKGEHKSLQYRLKGKLGIRNGLRVPFEHQGEIALPDLTSAPAKTY